MKNELKVIKLLQQETDAINSSHKEIDKELESIKQILLKAKKEDSYFDNDIFVDYKIGKTINKDIAKDFSDVVNIADKEITQNIKFRDILTDNDLLAIDVKVDSYISIFNKKHQLDRWDYAIGGGTGVFCGILDVLFISKPEKPTVSYSKKVNGLFNQWSQNAINKLIPPELTSELEKIYKIGGADTSTTNGFTSPISGKFNPVNHRFKALNHDPVLAFIIGALDVMNGTCTIVDNGSIKTMGTIKGASGDYRFFKSLGKILGHLASDFNAPSAKGNRGMGIPAPLMGLFGVFKDVKINNHDISKVAEYMYVNGYDARHFVTMSIPILINEVLIRVLYILKEIKYNKRTFFEVFKETIPLNLSPRFRMVLNLSYGAMVAVNTGKVAITKDILNANYAMWLVFTWNTLHSMRWLLWTKNTELQKYIDKELSKELEDLQLKISNLSRKVDALSC